MKRRNKGEYGYLRYRKQCQLIMTLIGLAIVLGIFFAGLIIFKSRNNYMTLVATVLTLPLAKIAVSYFILLPHKSSSMELYNAVTQKADKCKINFDCVFTTKEKVIGIQAVVITDSHVCAYTEETKIEAAYFEKAVKEFLNHDKLNANISLYNDEKQFLKRIETINASFDNDNKDCIDKMGWINDDMMIMCL